MEFIVPQFIEKEPKIIGPFTFKQFVFVGIAGLISFFLYFTIPFPYFVLSAILLLSTALFLAFFKVGGRSLPAIIKNFFFFFVSPKIYTWGRKVVPPKTIKKEVKEEEAKEAPTPAIAEKSQLRKLSTKIETMPR